MATRSEQLQIRVTPEEKAALRRAARRAGQDLSHYVRSRALPREEERLRGILTALREGEEGARFALAELNDFLAELEPPRFERALEHVDPGDLPPFERNYVAAMVEQAATRKNVKPPEWTRRVSPLEDPYFATRMKSLRLHLLRVAPVPFKRRNIFIDASVGDRV